MFCLTDDMCVTMGIDLNEERLEERLTSTAIMRKSGVVLTLTTQISVFLGPLHFNQFGVSQFEANLIRLI